MSAVLSDMQWVIEKKNLLDPVADNSNHYQVFRLLVYKFLRNKQFHPVPQHADPNDNTLPLGWNHEANHEVHHYKNNVYNFTSPISIAKHEPAVVCGVLRPSIYVFRMLLRDQEVTRCFQETELPHLHLVNGTPSNLDWILTGRLLDSLVLTFVPRWEEITAFGKIKINSSSSTPKERIENLRTRFTGRMSCNLLSQAKAVQTKNESRNEPIPKI